MYLISVLRLLQKRRERCLIENPNTMYTWNQLDSEGILPHILDQLKESVPPLYPLHTVIQLESVTELGKDEQKEYIQKHARYLREVVRKWVIVLLSALCEESCYFIEKITANCWGLFGKISYFGECNPCKFIRNFKNEYFLKLFEWNNTLAVQLINKLRLIS